MRKTILGAAFGGLLGLLASSGQAALYTYDVPNVAGEGAYELDLGRSFSSINSVHIEVSGNRLHGIYTVLGTDIFGNMVIDTWTTTPAAVVYLQDWVHRVGPNEPPELYWVATGYETDGVPIELNPDYDGWDFLLDGKATLLLDSALLESVPPPPYGMESEPAVFEYASAQLIIDASAVVPEPATLGMLAAIGGGVLLHRRR